MDFAFSEQQLAIDEAVRKVCSAFDDNYWTECEEKARFPEEYYRSMADGGWLGITMPEEVGGAGLGVTEAAIMMQAATSSGGGYSAASAIHINMFGPHAIVVHGTPDQKERWLRPLVTGEQKACFGVTEPDAGLDTTSIKTFAKRVEGGLPSQRQEDVDLDGSGCRQDPTPDPHHAEARVPTPYGRAHPLLYRPSTAERWRSAASTRWGATPSTPMRSS
jgi:alkylation response protein AidB-like acyl-CoA dehydrogenase